MRISLIPWVCGYGALSALLLSACGGVGAQIPATTPSSARPALAGASATAAPPTLGPAPASPPIAPTIIAGPTGIQATAAAAKGPLSPGERRAVAVARAKVARRTGVSRRALRLVYARPRTWPDSALGCPRPGRMYSQIVTPGYIVVLESAGTRYEVHTGRGDQAVICAPRKLNK